MPVIYLETSIKSDLNTCFDLSRSIDLHQISTSETNEKAIAGRTSGLIEADEFVTWKARHFGFTQKLTSKITGFTRPIYFKDEQIKGAFKYFIHEHHFEENASGLLMKDKFDFASPSGVLGKIFNFLVLTSYMKRLLIARNKVIKEYAESDKWREVL